MFYLFYSILFYLKQYVCLLTYLPHTLCHCHTKYCMSHGYQVREVIVLVRAVSLLQSQHTSPTVSLLLFSP